MPRCSVFAYPTYERCEVDLPSQQWRRQDLLQGGVGQSWKLGHGALTVDFRDRVQQLLDD